MRTLSAHLTAMDRQIQESLNIILEVRKEGNCLNQKNEWAGIKIPDLEVRIPKGVARTRGKAEDLTENAPDPDTEGSKTVEGDKRVRQETAEEGSHTFSEVGGAGQATHPPSKKVR